MKGGHRKYGCVSTYHPPHIQGQGTETRTGAMDGTGYLKNTDIVLVSGLDKNVSIQENETSLGVTRV